MHYNLVIISNLNFDKELFKNINYQILDESHYLVSSYLTNSNIHFDYLIFSNINTIKILDVLTDNNIVITNSYMQTNIDHIYAIGEINNSQKSINEQLKNIKENL